MDKSNTKTNSVEGLHLVEVNIMLEEANNYGLLPEVVVWALMAMQEDPKITPTDAVIIGYNEWIK